MNRKTISIILLVPFLALTAYAVMDVGYIGIIDFQMQGPAGWQVLVDLVIACILVLTWLIPDAKKAGRNPWPWVAMTVFLGSVGPLVYLATSKGKQP